MNPGIGRDKRFILDSWLADEAQLLFRLFASTPASLRKVLAGVVDGILLPHDRRFSLRLRVQFQGSNSLFYGLLTVILAVVYTGGVIILEGIFRRVIGPSWQSQSAIVISTLSIAALFSPLRRRIQNTIDRRFFRRNYNAELTLQTFAAALRNEVDLDLLTDALINLVEETIQPSSVSIWLNEPKKG